MERRASIRRNIGAVEHLHRRVVVVSLDIIIVLEDSSVLGNSSGYPEVINVERVFLIC